MGDNICEAFAVIADLCIALGEEPLTKHPGCWECVIDARWKIAVNGHPKAQKCSLSEIPIEPFHCYVEYNGWPAGIFNPYGGTIAAGEAANEHTFIAALRERIANAAT